MTMDPKPLWIKIISDNGGHYHNSELMTIISHWYDWYNVEVREWIFLEPREAKTTVDSHYATVNNFYDRIFIYFFSKFYINNYIIIDCTCNQKVCQNWM